MSDGQRHGGDLEENGFRGKKVAAGRHLFDLTHVPGRARDSAGGNDFRGKKGALSRALSG